MRLHVASALMPLMGSPRKSGGLGGETQCVSSVRTPRFILNLRDILALGDGAEAVREIGLCNQFAIVGEAADIAETAAVLEVEFPQRAVAALEDDADAELPLLLGLVGLDDEAPKRFDDFVERRPRREFVHAS